MKYRENMTPEEEAQLLAEIEAEGAAYADANDLEVRELDRWSEEHPIDEGDPDSETPDPIRDGWVSHRGLP